MEYFKENLGLKEWIEVTEWIFQRHTYTMTWERTGTEAQQGLLDILVQMEYELPEGQWPTLLNAKAKSSLAFS